MATLEENRALMEEVMNTHARNLAKKYGIKPSSFYIHIQTTAARETIIKPGTVVHIYTTILPIHPEANSYIRGWLRVIPKLIQRSELVSVKDMYEWNNQRRKLLALKGFDTDLLPDLLPNDRLHVTVLTKVVMKDQVTGLLVECESEKESSKSMLQKCRAILSQKVRELEQQARESELEKVAESSEIEIIKNE